MKTIGIDIGSMNVKAIVLEDSLIRDIPARIQDSLIGRNVNLTRSPIKPKAYKLTLADHSQVGIL